jgi:ABC-2 type transport system ATP-binding protein
MKTPELKEEKERISTKSESVVNKEGVVLRAEFHNSAVVTEGLTKKFGSFTAVDHVSLDVKYGEIFGFLGPNGAGKTTTILMLVTLISPSGGTAHVAGHDIATQPGRVRESIGYVSQDVAVDEYLTGRENLLVEGHLHHLKGRALDERIDDVLETVGMTEWAGELVANYSGGMRRRLDIAGGLVHRPQVLFLDEPTLGLDPQTRSAIWDYIRKLSKQGLTIFITTHYLDEADALCDRLAIIDQGKIKALDTPENLKRSLGKDLIEVTIRRLTPQEVISSFCEALRKLPMVLKLDQQQQQDYKLTISVTNVEHMIPQIFAIANGLGIVIDSISSKHPSLDDVFLALTGKALREERGDSWTGRRALERSRRVRA